MTNIMRAAIFDIDGTLTDSVDLNTKAWQISFQHFGHTFSFEDIRSQIGKGGDQLMPMFLSRHEIESRGKELEHYREKLFKKEFLPEVKSFPKVRELFERLFADGYLLALATSAKEEEVKIYEELCQITDLLTTTTSSDDVQKSKPHPDIFQAALRKLKTSPSECIIVGDSPYDAEAGIKAGVRPIGFRCGGFPTETLIAAGFLALYRDASELLDQYDHSLLGKFHAEDVCPAQ